MATDWDHAAAWQTHVEIMAERNAEHAELRPPSGKTECQIEQLGEFFENQLWCRTHLRMFKSDEGTLTQRCPYGAG